MIYAVIDTNVILSALITPNSQAATVKVFNHLLSNDITPLYDEDIIAEYIDVLCRKKFHIKEETIRNIIDFFHDKGINAVRIPTTSYMPDEDDRVFYEVSLSRDDSFLVTGNLRHYPLSPKIVSPREFLEITGLI